MSAKKIFFMLCIVSYSMNQVSCITCYECESHSAPACGSDPAKGNFQMDCFSTVFDNNSTFMSSDTANATLLSMLTNVAGIRANNNLNECAKLSGIWQGSEGIVRFCSSTTLSDDQLKEIAKEQGISVKTISRCDTDLCNSSSNLNVGFMCCVGALLLFLIMEL